MEFLDLESSSNGNMPEFLLSDLAIKKKFLLIQRVLFRDIFVVRYFCLLLFKPVGTQT